ncbi:DUF1415 domain-containing protein [Colwellia polaris]|jgi:hypothetical protein|uniref:DUF1415 domain-containing protein n=1 Tax=Colwellia polaris TaxID=326537 RepID=UPI000A175CF6|nr:DUF1415 domain-containing protein [Colwellia polaris]|tara:strand:+ start:6432 stop:6977 length:546 start_codon:yes stop_codon:yes gene_type:complete
MTVIHEIEQTKQWLTQVIINLNFCPFAKKEFVNQTIHYHVSEKAQLKTALVEFLAQCHYLNDNPAIETSLLIYSDGFRDFNRFLDLVDDSNDLIVEHGFEGIFQIATFHPEYCFADADYDDASNYTNRSPYPTLHLIREQSMERVLSVYKNPEAIPENNIALAEKMGAKYFQSLLHKISNS